RRTAGPRSRARHRRYPPPDRRSAEIAPGFPGRRSRRGSWWRIRPAIDPTPGCVAPFGARGVLMRPDHGAVEQEPLQVGVLQGQEPPLPGPLLRPAIEPPPDGVPVAEAFGEVPPGGAGLGDPEHGIDEEPVILGRDAGVASLPGQKVSDPLPVLILDLMASHG